MKIKARHGFVVEEFEISDEEIAVVTVWGLTQADKDRKLKEFIDAKAFRALTEANAFTWNWETVE
jgi:hypothetical protein